MQSPGSGKQGAHQCSADGGHFSFTFGHVRQRDSIAAAFLTTMAGATPLLSGAGQVAYVDLDDTMRQTYGYAKQGAGYGYTKVKGLNALLATISTPTAAPVIAAARLRKGAVVRPGAQSCLTLTHPPQAPEGARKVLRRSSSYGRRVPIFSDCRNPS